MVTRLVSSLHHAHSTLSSLTSHKHKHKKTPPPPSAPSAPLPPSPRSPPSSPPRRAAVLVSPPTPLPPPPPPPSSPLGSRLLSRLSHYLTSTLRLPATVTLDYSSAAQDLCSRLCGFLPPPLPLDDAMSVLHWLRRRRVALLLCPLDWHAKTTPLHTFLRFLVRHYTFHTLPLSLSDLPSTNRACILTCLLLICLMLCVCCCCVLGSVVRRSVVASGACLRLPAWPIIRLPSRPSYSHTTHTYHPTHATTGPHR